MNLRLAFVGYCASPAITPFASVVVREWMQFLATKKASWTPRKQTDVAVVESDRYDHIVALLYRLPSELNLLVFHLKHFQSAVRRS